MTGRLNYPQWIPWGAACVVLGLLTILTPLALGWGAPENVDWGRLSEISQTYAAVSIPLSGAALLGVAWSLVLQARQLRIDNEDRSRSAHRELLLRSVEDEDLLVCWEPPLYPMTREQYRRVAFINAIYNGWRIEYFSGLISDDVLQSAALRTMRGEVGRTHWKTTRPIWAAEAASMGRKYRNFVSVMDLALELAEAEGPPLTPGDYFLPDGG
ncbi:DUF6082 family protein [Streptomyces sp. NPDC005538]|uniref:DUF6082 family protein n=1 Tax=unclassified Streptomyces TaxID=2593676 RepID=UPI0033A6FD1A